MEYKKTTIFEKYNITEEEAKYIIDAVGETVEVK